MAEHRRLILKNFLSPEICKELVFIHKSCCTVGYRPYVFSTTLSHLIATNSAHLIMPFVSIRGHLYASWCKGASIGWHSDDNRDHLKQRDFSVVCYLNSYEVDFHGGLFHFQDGEPSTIAPMAGDVIIYTADDRNVHSVSEITEGERITLVLWFSRDASHDEDAKLLKSLSDFSLGSHSHIGSISSCFPKLASTNMYWFPPEEASRFQSGFNICSARLHFLGFDIYSSDKSKNVVDQQDISSSYYLLKFLEEPLYLSRGDELLTLEFVNILHALQVVQFYNWKASELETAQLKGPSVNIVHLSELQRKKIDGLKAVLLKDVRLAHTLVWPTSDGSMRMSFDWSRFSALVSEWEGYTLKLLKELDISLPYWRTHHSIFSLINRDG